MRMIKFRGKDILSGKLVYGVNIKQGKRYEDSKEAVWIGDDKQGLHWVEKDSVAQLSVMTRTARKFTKATNSPIHTVQHFW